MPVAKVALLFPGQGSQIAGMCAKWCDRSAIVRAVVDEVSTATGLDVRAIFEDAEALTRTSLAQAAIFACCLAIHGALRERPPPGTIVALAGHSVGELAALTVAGRIALADAARLVHTRGLLMEEAMRGTAGAMTAVFGLAVAEVEAVCADVSTTRSPVHVANDNSSVQVVISGAVAGVERAATELTRRGAVTHRLPVTIAAHSPWMQAAVPRLRAIVDALVITDTPTPVYSSVFAGPLVGAEAVRASTVAQLTRRVVWRDTMTALVASGVEAVIEVGPRTVLRDLFKLEHPRVLAFSASEPAGADALHTALERADVTIGPALAGFIPRCLAIAAATPNHGSDRAGHAQAVMAPNRRLRELREEIERVPTTAAHVREAAQLLSRILRGKRLPEAERRARIGGLIRDTAAHTVLPDFEA